MFDGASMVSKMNGRAPYSSGESDGISRQFILPNALDVAVTICMKGYEGLFYNLDGETLSLRPRQGLGAEGWPTRTISRPLGALAFDAAFHIEEAETRSYITGTTFYLWRSTSIGPRMKRDGGCNVLEGLTL